MSSAKSKKKDEGVQFTAENIDNTAPVKKILDELQVKNHQAYMFYSRNLKQRITYIRDKDFHSTIPGHPLKHFEDDWDGEFDMDYFESLPYKSSPPKMISTTIKNIDKVDPVTSYMKTKMDWQRNCCNFKRTASLIAVVDKYESLNDEVVQCPQHLVSMAAHMDSDPDAHFDSAYNWYYAGHGNMQLVCIDWVDYLLHSELSTLYLTEFKKNNLSINSEPTATFDCGENNNILETICSTLIIVLRTKFKIFLLKIINENDELRMEKIKCAESELPYTSVTFDNYHKNILYVTTLDNKLSIVNLDRLKARSVKLQQKTPLLNNWNTVLSSSRGFYTHVGRKSITIYDKRANNMVYQWKNLRDMTDEIECNDISVAKFIGENFLYFGTDHHLFLMDVRNSNETKVVQRWTHGMDCVPTYITSCNSEFNKDLIVLSSQWCEDMCVITNYKSDTKNWSSNGVGIPYRPPSILTTLDEARQKILCSELYNPIDGRVCTSITGVLVLENGEKCDILMQNSLGDVSYHMLFPEYMETFIENDSPQCLHEWSANFRLPKKDFEVSEVRNIANIWRKLKKMPDNFRIEEDLIGKSKFDEAEIFKAFEDEDIDVGLQDIWLKEQNETTNNELELNLKIYFSDEENGDSD